jgi:Fur family transcriptional regulator, ferric uptake regulator
MHVQRGPHVTQPRQTKQQAAIGRVITHSDRPLSPGEILAKARRQIPTLSLATVYRALRRLEQSGSASKVEIPGQPPRFESRLAAGKHHHHFVCGTCDRVFDIPGCVRGVEALAPAGFSVESHEIVLFGRCGACSASA